MSVVRLAVPWFYTVSIITMNITGAYIAKGTKVTLTIAIFQILTLFVSTYVI